MKKILTQLFAVSSVLGNNNTANNPQSISTITQHYNDISQSGNRFLNSTVTNSTVTNSTVTNSTVPEVTPEVKLEKYLKDLRDKHQSTITEQKPGIDAVYKYLNSHYEADDKVFFNKSDELLFFYVMIPQIFMDVDKLNLDEFKNPLEKEFLVNIKNIKKDIPKIHSFNAGLLALNSMTSAKKKELIEYNIREFSFNFYKGSRELIGPAWCEGKDCTKNNLFDALTGDNAKILGKPIDKDFTYFSSPYSIKAATLPIMVRDYDLIGNFADNVISPRIKKALEGLMEEYSKDFLGNNKDPEKAALELLTTMSSDKKYSKTESVEFIFNLLPQFLTEIPVTKITTPINSMDLLKNKAMEVYKAREKEAEKNNKTRASLSKCTVSLSDKTSSNGTVLSQSPHFLSYMIAYLSLDKNRRMEILENNKSSLQDMCYYSEICNEEYTLNSLKKIPIPKNSTLSPVKISDKGILYIPNNNSNMIIKILEEGLGYLDGSKISPINIFDKNQTNMANVAIQTLKDSFPETFAAIYCNNKNPDSNVTANDKISPNSNVTANDKISPNSNVTANDKISPTTIISASVGGVGGVATATALAYALYKYYDKRSKERQEFDEVVEKGAVEVDLENDKKSAVELGQIELKPKTILSQQNVTTVLQSVVQLSGN